MVILHASFSKLIISIFQDVTAYSKLVQSAAEPQKTSIYSFRNTKR